MAERDDNPRFPGDHGSLAPIIAIGILAGATAFSTAAPVDPLLLDDTMHEAAPALEDGATDPLLLPQLGELPDHIWEASPAVTSESTVPGPPEPLLLPWPPADTILPPRAAIVPTVVIRDVEFDGNTAFSDEDLHDLVGPFLGRPLTPTDLDAIRFAITKLYIDHHFITSGAIIPEQDLTDGTLEIQIKEGDLTDVFVMENTRLRSSWFIDRLKYAGRAPLNFRTLQQSLQVLQTNPNIRRINAGLRPGLLPGEALMAIRVEEEENPWSYGVDVHNQRPPSTGAEQIELWTRSTNLTGVSDSFHARFGLLSGGFDEPEFSDLDNLYLNYRRPLFADDTTLEILADQRDYVIIDEVFAPLDIEGETWRLAAGLRRPLLRRFDNEKSIHDEIWLSLMLERTHSETYLLGTPFSINRGAVNGELDLAILRFGQEWTRRTASSVLALRSTLSFGLDALGSTDSRGEPDSTFTSWNLSGQYLKRLRPRGDMILINGGFQWCDSPLPSQEQWTLGGRYTVRGYRENTLVRDNGAFLGVEYRYPIFDRREEHDWRLSLAPFLDLGYGRNRGTPDEEFLASVGLGLLLEYRDWLRGELYWGHDLNPYQPQSGNLQDSGIHFRMTIAEF
jgi:hemolysin activation/secretion protein